MKIVIGIDPGSKGVAVLMIDGRISEKININDNGIGAFAEWIQKQKNSYDVAGNSFSVVMEEVHAVFGSSAKATFSFGEAVGMAKAVLVMAKVKHTFVPPKTWQKIVWCNGDVEYKPAKEESKRKVVNTKKTSLNAATRIFPGHDFRKSQRAKNPDDNYVDAALIAEYGMMINF